MPSFPQVHRGLAAGAVCTRAKAVAHIPKPISETASLVLQQVKRVIHMRLEGHHSSFAPLKGALSDAAAAR